jgi:hypothetical protein
VGFGDVLKMSMKEGVDQRPPKAPTKGTAWAASFSETTMESGRQSG